MLIIYWIICSSFITLTIIWIARIETGKQWLRSRKKTPVSEAISESKIFILMPVLNEAKRLSETIKYFVENFALCCDLRIIIITTEAEDHRKINGSDRNTIQVADKLSRDFDIVKAVHYPHKGRKMAHQLNYAISVLDREIGDDDLIAIYNADSRPHPKTLSWTMEAIRNGNECVFQQYGNYLENFYALSSRPFAWVLRGAALWQARWSIGFEIFHALKQGKISDPEMINYPFNYCIGHGLIFRKKILRLTGYFDEKFYNEDAIFGLRLCDLGIKINPIPYFDVSDSPDSIKGYLTQQSNWFRGPFEAFGYYSKICGETKKMDFKRKIRLLFLSMKLFFHSVYWVIGPTLLLMVLVIPILAENYFLLPFSVAVALSYAAIPSFYSFTLIKKENEQTSDLRIKVISTLLGCIIAHFLHGLGAYIGIFNFIFRRSMQKTKTPMQKC